MNERIVAKAANDEEPKLRRGKGRPLSPGQAVGRDALIKAACDLLEQLPPAKVTRAEVARHAGVDPALIRYYFHDRGSLLLSVVRQIVDGPPLGAPLPPDTNSLEVVRANAHAFLRFMTAHPYFHRLLIEELGQSDSDETRDVYREVNMNSIVKHKSVVDEGVARGQLKPVNPLLLHIAQIGLCEFFLAARPLIEELMGEDVDMDDITAQYADLIGNMMVGGLRP